MSGQTTPMAKITLHPFGREDFSRLISWLPTEADLIEWCAAFFKYPLTEAQLERYLESTKQPNSRVIFTARSAADVVVDGKARFNRSRRRKVLEIIVSALAKRRHSANRLRGEQTKTRHCLKRRYHELPR